MNSLRARHTHFW